jgi:AcrR family transcriptional regulator
VAQRNDGVDSRRTDTRHRILSVALRLFAERGYANTSLREIAEQLDVTKAALYFHYKTKEDIVTGILGGYLDGLDALLDDAARQPATRAGRELLLRRLADHQAAWGVDLTRLVRQNYTEISILPVGADLRTSHRRLLTALTGPNSTLLSRTRARTAVAALQTVALSATLEDGDEDELREAALTVALEVLHGGGDPTPPN